MATRTIANGGGNWSATGTWVEGAVPIAGDAVVATATSGQLTVDVASACATLILTNYVNTMTFNATLTVTSTVTFVAGMTIAGTSDLIKSGVGAATWTSGGKTLTGGIQLNGAATVTLSGAWVINGTLTFGAAAVLNSSTLSAGGLTVTSVTGTGSTAVTLTGGTWSGGGAFDNSTALTLAGNVTVSGTVRRSRSSIVYSSGTITTTGSTLQLGNSASVTLNTPAASMHWNNITKLSNDGFAVTLAADLTCDGTFSASADGSFTTLGNFLITCAAFSTSGMTLAHALTCTGLWTIAVGVSTYTGTVTAGSATISGTITLASDQNIQGTTTVTSNTVLNTSTGKVWNTYGLTVNNSITLTGTAKVVFNGTGTWTQSGTGTIANSVDINTSGTLTLSGNPRYLTGTLRYLAGTVSGALGTGGSFTLDAATGGTLPGLTFVITGTVTLTSTLTVTTLTLGDVACTFAGSFGAVIGTLTMTSLTASRTFTFAANVEYNITTAFNTVGTTSAIRAAFKSGTGGTKAKLTLQGAATQDVGFADPTDIDSNNGQTIFSYKGTITTTFNWTATMPQRIGRLAIGHAG